MLLNTSNTEWLQALTLRAIACATEVSNMLSFFYLEKIRDIIMKTSNKEWLRALKLRAISFLVLWSLPRSSSYNTGNIKLTTCIVLLAFRLVPPKFSHHVFRWATFLLSFILRKYETCYWTLQAKNDFTLSNYARLAFWFYGLCQGAALIIQET